MLLYLQENQQVHFLQVDLAHPSKKSKDFSKAHFITTECGWRKLIKKVAVKYLLHHPLYHSILCSTNLSYTVGLIETRRIEKMWH